MGDRASTIHLPGTHVFKRIILAPLLYLLFVGTITAQEVPSDSAMVQAFLSQALQPYIGKLGGYHSLYTGPEYNYTYAAVEGHPYFQKNSFQPATISYNGILYQDVLSKYDLASSEIVLKSKDNRSLKLLSEKLDSFSFGPASFIVIAKEPAAAGVIEAGFYQVLHRGAVTVLVNRSKRPRVSFQTEDAPYFVERKKFYAQKGETYFLIDSENDLFNLFGDRKQELKTFLKAGKLSFKKDTEEAILKVVAHSEQ